MHSGYTDSSSVCIGCASSLSPSIVLDIGVTELSTAVCKVGTCVDRKIPLQMRFCETCGLFQLNGKFESQWSKGYPAVQFREPEKHLDRVCGEVLKSLLAFGLDQPVYGFTPKDHSLLQRFEDGGLVNRGVIFDYNDLSDHSLSVSIDNALVNKPFITNAGLIVCRHVLEHSNQISKMLGLISKNAQFAYFEVPLVSNITEQGKYWYIWEDHRSYFDMKSLEKLLLCYGFEILVSGVEKNLSESIGWVFVKNPLGRFGLSFSYDNSPTIPNVVEDKTSELSKKIVIELQRKGLDRIVFFGAGHVASRLLHLIDKSSCAMIDLSRVLIVDESTEKQGSRLPNSDLQVLPPDAIPFKSLVIFVVNHDSIEFVAEYSRRLRDRDCICVQLDEFLNYELSEA